MDPGPTASARTGGRSLGKYRLIAELGQGGMADVYLAVVRGPAGFNKLVVVKQIRPSLAQDPEFLAMFLDEARLAARLSHPNVVQTNEVGSDGDDYFIAMEYLEGQPLNRVVHRLGRDGAMPVAMHLRVIAEMLAGLHHAHELCDFDGTPLHVVHRDVTPHNVFVTYDGQVKVVDFGIAKAMNSSAETKSGVLKGKVAYMAPEQAHGDRVDRRADVFSAGVMLWEVATGQRLWKGLPDIAVLQRLVHGDIPAPRTIAPGVDPALEAIVMKALARDREDRYATALDLQSAIEAHLEGLGERVGARDLARLVAPQFVAERAKIKDVIDRQIRAMSEAEAPVAQSLPSIDAVAGLPDLGSSIASYTAPGVAGPPAAHRRRRGLVVGAALAASALLAGGLWAVTRGSASASPSPSSPSSPALAADEVHADAAASSVPVTPATPASAAIPVEPTASSAPGGDAGSARPAASSGSTTTGASPSSPGAAGGTRQPASGTDDMKRPTAAPRRTLDASNPYGH